MSDNKFIEEDFERISAQEMAFIKEEKKRQMDEEWERWELEQLGFERKPAIIKVITVKKEETNNV